jgi:hypothetical protein
VPLVTEVDPIAIELAPMDFAPLSTTALPPIAMLLSPTALLARPTAIA